MVIKGSSIPGKKSVLVAYLLWLFGGIFGVHHFYLRRDRHAFVWWTTLGGFGIGWLGEILRIPRYVRDANEDPKYMEELVGRMVRNKKVKDHNLRRAAQERFMDIQQAYEILSNSKHRRHRRNKKDNSE
ncbi:hypothetical protein MSG28_001164 [Choristoneura fumiferana]|uniref:Uncharacterized protein n=1 Tax=Choristoneura fumiferana TaxID=7141 RepID=A0ACC0K427_CHOFU|nr:hypothetical protein MSG28_001164 [Choristoneura fumiferana]